MCPPDDLKLTFADHILCSTAGISAKPNISFSLTVPYCAGLKCSLRGLLPAFKIFLKEKILHCLHVACLYILLWPGRTAYWGNLPLNIETKSLRSHSYSQSKSCWCFQWLLLISSSWWKWFYHNCISIQPVCKRQNFHRKKNGALFPIIALMHQILVFGFVLLSSTSENNVSSQLFKTVSVNRSDTTSCLCLEYVSFI